MASLFIYLFFCRANLRNKHRTVGLCERAFTRGRHKSFYRRTERNALPLWTRNKCFSRFFYSDWASKGKSKTMRPSPAIREHRAWRNENPLVPSYGTFTWEVKVGSKRTHNPGGGVLPYMGYIGMCRCEGYGFHAVYSRIGYINQSVWVKNRVSFFKKLISWLKILSRLGKQLL